VIAKSASGFGSCVTQQIEGEPENVQALLSDLTREELEAVAAEAIDALLDASERAEKEIARFQRRAAQHRGSSDAPGLR